MTKDMIKRLKIAVIFLAVVFCLCGCKEKTEKPLAATKEFYINDFANVIDSEDEKDILTKAVALNESTSAQVVVVTIDSLDGKEIADYALEIGREWGVGDKEKNNGIVILLSEGDREIYISVGYGLEGALPDSKTGRIIDIYGLEYLKSNDFSNGVTAIADAVINEVYIEYDLTPSAGYTAIDNIPQSNSVEASGSKVAVSWAVLIVILIVFALLSRRGGRMPFIWFIGGPPRFGGGGGFGSGGGFGGFSGGGGSFGGGGAGRKF